MFVVGLASCDQAPDITPGFLDTDLQEYREHAVLDKQNFIISDVPSKIHPIEHANGMLCIPATQARDAVQYLIDMRKKCNL